MAARFIALAKRQEGLPRLPLTMGGRLIVDTEQAWEAADLPHEGARRRGDEYGR